jgi:uncharacterized protein with von Willebrand factor type A (vWA) domain
VLTGFFFTLRAAGVPVAPNEWLQLLGALRAGVADTSVESFHTLARTVLVKDERYYDRYDRAFGAYFKGVEDLFADLDLSRIPAEWLARQAELRLTDAERAAVEKLGGFEKLMETLRERLNEQEGRHQGGNKWIGTAGRSPFGAYGDHPEGVRIGQEGNRRRSAVKVWDKREFRNFDDQVELGTRNLKVALRKLRKFARSGAEDLLDLDSTIASTARNAGLLDIRMQAERHNAVKVLLFLDVGGSMDDHVKLCEELFSAARAEFKHLEHYYFHNFTYESLWKENGRRHAQRIPTDEVLRTYGRDYRAIFLGDATMGPYEIAHAGGSVEHWNDEPGAVWFRRLTTAFPHFVWLNPEPQERWGYSPSVKLVRELAEDRMFPLTLRGLDDAIRVLQRK